MERISSSTEQLPQNVVCLETTGWATYVASFRKFGTIVVVVPRTIPVKYFWNYPSLP